MRLLIVVAFIMLAVACQQSQEAQLPNPASQYCVEHGGALSIVDEPAGQRGVCTLADGTVCDEWAYFRGECPAVCEPCPQYLLPGPDFCKDGRLVTYPVDGCGCQAPPTCEPCGDCPQLAPPSPGFCPQGRIVYEVDSCGCQSAPRCEPVACTMDAKICPDGSAVGRVAPDCAFAPCPCEDTETKSYLGKTAEECAAVSCAVGTYFSDDCGCGCLEEERFICTDEQRQVTHCAADYDPVCGWYSEKVKCLRYPCAITATNPCKVCAIEDIAYYTMGQCPAGDRITLS